jgi:dTMP kinase
MKKGLFITLEGGEGTGKTVQGSLLYEYLKTKYRVLLTREPGGTEDGEIIRRILLTGKEDKIHPVTEALLYLSSRAEHWHRKIKPALSSGMIVISDRFQDSTIVYQGYCKNVGAEFLDSIYSFFTEGAVPDRTYLLSVDPKIGIERSINRHGNIETRFENMDISFHKNVHDYYLKVYRENRDRISLIDSSDSIEDIHKTIKEDVDELLSSLEFKN